MDEKKTVKLQFLIAEDLENVLSKAVGQPTFKQFITSILELLDERVVEFEAASDSLIDQNLDDDFLDEICEEIDERFFDTFEGSCTVATNLTRVRVEGVISLVMEILGDNVNSELIVLDPYSFQTQKVQ